MSAVNDGKCSPWVMCSCSVVSGNQIRDNMEVTEDQQTVWFFLFLKIAFMFSRRNKLT